MKRIFAFLFLITLVTLQSCKTGAPPDFRNRPMPVSIGTVTQKDVPLYLEVIGNVSAFVTVQVRPQISGILLKAHVTQGQEVKKGDLLYTINPAAFKAALNRAESTLKKDEATLEYAKKKVERYQELVKKKFISELSFEQYQTDVQIAEAQILIDKAEIQAAKVNLSYCYIKSPIDGKVGQYIVDPGNRVTPSDSQPLTEVRQITPINILFSLSQRDFQRLQNSFSSESFPFDVILPNEKEPITEGKVYFIDNHIDLGTGTILLKGVMPNEDQKLWPGAFVRVRMLLEIQKDALLVPSETIQHGQQGTYLFVVKEDQTVDLRPVVVGQNIDGYTVVKEGITLNDKVITDGQINLRPGSKVFVPGATEAATP